MEFDKSRVYTAVNADELPIGSKCVFADTIQGLKERKYIDTLIGIADERRVCRFASEHGSDWKYALAYLIEPPAEPKYKPFESVEKAMDAIKKHGGWLERKSDGLQGIVVAKSGDRIKAVQCWYRLGDMFQSLVFADDGSPCGELVEE
jgi:hypothetical protein